MKRLHAYFSTTTKNILSNKESFPSNNTMLKEISPSTQGYRQMSLNDEKKESFRERAEIKCTLHKKISMIRSCLLLLFQFLLFYYDSHSIDVILSHIQLIFILKIFFTSFHLLVSFLWFSSIILKTRGYHVKLFYTTLCLYLRPFFFTSYGKKSYFMESFYQFYC